MGVPTVTYLPFHGYIVAPPGPITSIHIQKELRSAPPWETDAKKKKPRFLFLLALLSSASQLWTASFNDWLPEAQGRMMAKWLFYTCFSFVCVFNTEIYPVRKIPVTLPHRT